MSNATQILILKNLRRLINETLKHYQNFDTCCGRPHSKARENQLKTLRNLIDTQIESIKTLADQL